MKIMKYETRRIKIDRSFSKFRRQYPLLFPLIISDLSLDLVAVAFYLLPFFILSERPHRRDDRHDSSVSDRRQH